MTFEEATAKFLAAWDAGEVRFNVEHIEDKLSITGLVYADIRAVVASSETGAIDGRDVREDSIEKWEFFGFPNTVRSEITVVADFKKDERTILVTIHYSEEIKEG